MVFGLATIGLNGFSMVANHWSNYGMVTIHRYGLLQRKETMLKDEIEVLVDTRTSLQAQVKTSEDMVTGQEVKLRGTEALTSLLEEKLQATKERLKVANVELDTTKMRLEEEFRRSKALQAKVEQCEDKEEKNDDEIGKNKEDIEAKCQEVAKLKGEVRRFFFIGSKFLLAPN